MSAGRTVWLLRSFDPARGARIELRVTDPAGRVIDSFRLAAPLVGYFLRKQSAYRDHPGQYADPWGAIRNKWGDPGPDKSNS